jgi:tetratricopeptide (TPR) repeat protein
VGLAIAAAWGVPALLERALGPPPGKPAKPARSEASPKGAQRAAGERSGRPRGLPSEGGPPPGRWLASALAGAVVAAFAVGARAELHHWRDSEVLMRRALAVTRGNFVAHAHLGSALLERGEVAEAAAHWRESVRLRPDHVTAVNNLAWLLATHPDPRHRDPREALALAERAVALAPDDPAVLDTLGAALAASGRFAAAEGAAQRAAERAREAGRLALAADALRRAALYRSGQAYRGAE